MMLLLEIFANDEWSDLNHEVKETGPQAITSQKSKTQEFSVREEPISLGQGTVSSVREDLYIPHLNNVNPKTKKETQKTNLIFT